MDVLSHFRSGLSLCTNRPYLGHYVFKMLMTERKWRFCSIIQISEPRNFPSSSPGLTLDYLNDHIPIPSIPEESSYVKTELILTSMVLVDFSKIAELRFSLPVGLDKAILCDHRWSFDCDNQVDDGNIDIANFVTIWEISDL